MVVNGIKRNRNKRKKGYFLLDEVQKWRPEGTAKTLIPDGASVTPSNNGSEGNCRIKSTFCLTASIWGKNGLTPFGVAVD